MDDQLEPQHCRLNEDQDLMAQRQSTVKQNDNGAKNQSQSFKYRLQINK